MTNANNINCIKRCFGKYKSVRTFTPDIAADILNCGRGCIGIPEIPKNVHKCGFKCRTKVQGVRDECVHECNKGITLPIMPKDPIGVRPNPTIKPNPTIPKNSAKMYVADCIDGCKDISDPEKQLNCLAKCVGETPKQIEDDKSIFGISVTYIVIIVVAIMLYMLYRK